MKNKYKDISWCSNIGFAINDFKVGLKSILLTTPSIAMYKSFLGLTMENILSMYSKIKAIISSSFFGAGLNKKNNSIVYNMYAFLRN